jgi:hypothetical protein
VSGSDGAGPPFVIIGENIHCSRVVKRDGNRGGVTPDGRPAVRFPADDGGEAYIPLPDPILESSEFRVSQRIKHVMAAVRVGLAGGPDAETAATYVAWMAARQIEGGAAYLDLNVDEIDHDVDGRLAAMVWLVRAVGPVSSVPLSIDSSDAAVLEAGLEAIDPAWASGARPMINSASMERPQTLDLCLERGLPVVLSCTGDTMPSDAPERITRARDIVGLALEKGLRPGDLYVDTLVIPIGVDPEAGNYYLDAVRFVRSEYGPDILISDVFLDLCVQAGQDSGIVDPVAADIRSALAPDRSAEPYRLAADMLTGRDAFGVEFIDAYRAGRLSGPT